MDFINTDPHVATMYSFVQRLERYEPDVVNLVIWFLGFRIGDVVASWRKNIKDLLELVTETGSGWNLESMVKLGAVGQGQVLLGRLNNFPRRSGSGCWGLCGR